MKIQDLCVAECYETLMPEKRLLLAILRRGVLDAGGFLSGVPLSLAESRRALTQNAKGWIYSKSTEVGSFLWVCSELDLSPSSVRALVPDTQQSKHIKGAPKALLQRLTAMEWITS